RDRPRDEPRDPERLRSRLGRLGSGVRGETETRDEDERQRQQPDEETIRERTRDDPAADLAVAVGHLEDRIERPVLATLGLRSISDSLRTPRHRLPPL